MYGAFYVFNKVKEVKIYKKSSFIYALSILLAVVSSYLIQVVSNIDRDKKFGALSNEIASVKSLVQKNIEQIAANEENVKNTQQALTNIETSIGHIQNTIVELQKAKQLHDEKLHIHSSDSNGNLSKDYKEQFVETLGGLIKEGTPFRSLLSNCNVDLSAYASGSELLEFQDENVKTTQCIISELEVLAKELIGKDIRETFWQKQKRVFKEKFGSVIKLFQNVDNKDLTKLSDDQLFEVAINSLHSKEFNKALQALNLVKNQQDKLRHIEHDIKQRAELNEKFFAFKKEFSDSDKSKKLAEDVHTIKSLTDEK